MKPDKRRHDAPELRRDYEDRKAKREASFESHSYYIMKKDPNEEPTKSPADELRALAEIIGSTGASIGKAFRGFKADYMIIDELPDTLPKRVPDYVSDKTWAGWLPEPADLRGKQKKKWHSTQYKAYKKWNADAELREAVEAQIIGESREDLGWGGF